jgi:molybdopterin-containing oxidoreductase family iron-sulfur binding subunit
MKLMGASLALAGLAGCTRQPDEPIYPYVKQPEDLILGKPMYFATAHPFVTGAVPLLVKSDQFRPIKIDGNPEHPYNQGSSDPFTQATLLELYDPDRSQHVTWRGENREWAEFGHGDVLPERDHYLAHAGAAMEGSAGSVSESDAGAVRPGDCRDGVR